jgi:sialate O-acetylesterase
MRYRVWAPLALAAAALFLAGTAHAAVKPHGLVSEGMVLQQQTQAPLWGSADEGEDVTVTFRDKDYKATALGGKWSVKVETGKAGGPFPLTIAGKTNKVELKNVLVGEVWVCSGQSNMEWTVMNARDSEDVIRHSGDPQLRLFTVPKLASPTLVEDVPPGWKECGPDAVIGFSAVAYFFGRDLRKSLGVPVGLIHTSWGGTPAEAWTRRAVLEGNAELKGMADGYDQAVKGYYAALPSYADALAKYHDAVANAAKEQKEAPPPPGPPQFPGRNQNSPSTLYNGMIAPLVPYAIKGAIWYQGESNAGRAYQYRTLFPAMIQNWRDDWKQGDFPFLFVQLAPWGARGDTTGVTWAELREAQLLTTQKLKNTGMAVITDVGEEYDIHPRKKEPVGHRLALAAEGIAYGQKVDYTGPLYDKMKVEDGKAVLSFRNVGGGLVAKGGPLEGFTVAGDDGKFVKAEAEVKGDTVVVWSKDVPKPAAVRFGWSNLPVVNLFDKDGLPATPFRTDDFPLVTGPKPAGG